MLVKFHFDIPSDCWENCKKSYGNTFAALCEYKHTHKYNLACTRASPTTYRKWYTEWQNRQT